jgi:hypothetical protein
MQLWNVGMLQRYYTVLYPRKPSSSVIVVNDYHVRFQVLTAASMMFGIVFWDVLPYFTPQYIPEDSSQQNDYHLCEEMWAVRPQLLEAPFIPPNLRAVLGRAMGLTISSLPLTAEAWGQSVWYLWRTKWHWDRFFSEFRSPLSTTFDRGSPFSYIIWGLNSRPHWWLHFRHSHLVDMNNKGCVANYLS